MLKKKIAWDDISLDVDKLRASRQVGTDVSVNDAGDVRSAFFLLSLSSLVRLLPLVLLLVLAFGCATTQSTIPKETYYPVVSKSIEHGDADTAIMQLSSIPEGRRDAKYHLLLGQAYFKKGNYPLAIENFRKCLEKESQNENAKYGLAIVYVEMGRYDLAEKYLKELAQSQRPEVASEAKEKLSFVYFKKGHAQYKKHRYEKAIGFYQKALTDAPSSMKAEIYYYLGMAFFRKGDEANAKASWQKAISFGGEFGQKAQDRIDLL